MKAGEFDQAFNRGEDVSSALDLAAAQRPGLEQRRVNVDFPVWMIESLDREARRLGVTRQSVIKVWIAEHLERRDSAAALRGYPRPDYRQRSESCAVKRSGATLSRQRARLGNALSAAQSVQVELPGPFDPDHDREVSAYVDGEISAAELYRRTVARYR
jgi:transposase-like protein